jgi:CysZ protein
MMTEFSRGAGFALQGFRLIRRPRIRRFVIVPLLINVLIFAGVIWYAVTQFDLLLDWLTPTLPTWLDWLQWLIWLLWPVFAVAVALVVFYLFTPIANLIGAPFNALLAERLETQLTDTPAADGDKGLISLLKGTGKTIVSELKKLLYLIAWAIPLLLLFIIPGINVLAPLIWFIFSAWMLSLEYTDYPMGNHNLNFRQERDILGRRRSLALGFGSAVAVMTMIPIVNFLAMPVAVAGATAMWVDHLKGEV